MPNLPAASFGGVLQSHAVEDFVNVSRPLITAAFKNLLEEKHLYQSADLLSDAQIASYAKQVHAKRESELASAFHSRSRNDAVGHYE